jgi:hypothetical protein
MTHKKTFEYFLKVLGHGGQLRAVCQGDDCSSYGTGAMGNRQIKAQEAPFLGFFWEFF